MSLQNRKIICDRSKIKVKPKYKIHNTLNLPKIRKQQEDFQSILDSYESSNSSLSIRDHSLSLRDKSISFRDKSISFKSIRKQSVEQKQISESYSLYGLSKIQTDRNPLKLQKKDSINSDDQQEPQIEVKSNQDWMEWCQQTREPQAMCKYFCQRDKQYYWEDVKVLEYDGYKFIVQKYPDGPIKKVSRHGIKFKHDTFKFTQIIAEDPTISKHQRITKEQKILQQIQEIQSKKSSSLPIKIESKILKNLKKSVRFQSNPKVNQLIQILFEEVKENYSFEMKKCQFTKYQNRYAQQFKPIKKCEYYQYYQTQIKKNGIMLQNKIVEVLQILDFNFKKFHLPQIMNFKPKPLPLKYEQYLEILNLQLENVEIQLNKQRVQIIIEIQEKVEKIFNFYISDYQQYQNSDLQKFVRRLDYQYTIYIHNVLKEKLQEIKDFYHQFQWHQPINLKYCASTFFHLKIVVSQKVNSRSILSKRYSIFHIHNNDLMGIEPDLDECKRLFLMPSNELFNIANNIEKMEVDLVSLLTHINNKSLQNLIHFPDSKELNELKQIEYQIQAIIESEYQKCFDIVQQFRQFQYLLNPIKDKMINRVFGIESKEKPPLTQLKMDTIIETITKLLQAKQSIQAMSTDVVHVGLFTLETKEFKKELIKGIQTNLQALLTKILDLLNHNIGVIQHEYEQMLINTSTAPKSEIDLIQRKLFVDEIKIHLSKMQMEINKVEEFINLLEINFFEFDFSIQKSYFELKPWPEKIIESIKNNKFQIEAQEKKFLSQLQNDKNDFQDKLTQLQEQFIKIKALSDYQNIKDSFIEIKIFQEWIQQAYEMLHSFNSREQLLQMQISQFTELDSLMNDFKPFSNLWELAIQFETEREIWLHGSFKVLNHQQIQLKLINYINQTVELSNFFREIQEENAQTFARGFRRSLDAMRELLWVIEALAIEAFAKKPALWREFFKDCKIPNFDPKTEFSLQSLINRGVLNVKEQVLFLSQKVEKGWNIEKRLNEMQEKLISVNIELQDHRETFLLKNYDEVQAILDEQLNILTMLKSQQHIKMVLGRANQLEYKIVLIQDTLEYGMKCQKNWIYLDPIFTSEDIKKKLTMETNDFIRVDQSYRQCMQQFDKIKLLWDCIENEKLKNEFQQNVIVLDQIQKNLSQYLEQKRIQFPRFYFVSDEELIEILAQTKDPLQIQKHIYKCFEGIHELRFQKNHVIQAMLSLEGETIYLSDYINVSENEKNGSVEQWLLELEKEMKISIKNICNSCLGDHLSTKGQAISKWPTQCFLLVNHIKWTRNTETAILQLQKTNLTQFLFNLNQELQETVQLVRKEQKLRQKTTLEAMVVMEVHAKDIVSNLQKENISNINDFAWISQLRYYVTDINAFQVKMVNASVNYGFEYLGKITRLVITSLTDRCQRTLLGALHMHYGGAPEGPAGTGKSETVKDLAKAVAMPCIVFNCSDGLNYIAMGKFFKGLASSGAWCCFDEFNRIDPEVLSVVAQQIFTIQKAIKEDRQRFVFEGEEIALVSTCAINVTMNPGYAGRSELPDNLKILFRPCAMMVPDYAMIAEIYLYSIGFEKARELSSKIVTCLKLCNEQLSPQDHYDFGMRALKSVLSTAKNLFDGSEETICLTALININKSKFTESDTNLFLAITSDLFPGVNILETQDLELTDMSNDLILESRFIEKCIQLKHSIEVRNGVMCIGKTFSGKSSVIATLAKSMNAQVFKINPKSLLVDQLYGKLDPDTKQWSDGVVPIVIRENLGKGTIWIVFDGPVDSLWIENLNTVLDDNKKLCLTSGEILKIPQNMSMLFEVEDLQAASPATISRCGMIYFLEIDWNIQLQQLKLNEEHNLLKQKIKNLIEITQELFKQISTLPVYYNVNILFNSFVKLLNFYLPQFINYEQFDNYLLFCLIWSFGASMDNDQRKQFNDLLLKISRNNRSKNKTEVETINIKLPQLEKRDFFQYIYRDNQWIEWIKLYPTIQVNSELQFHQIIIPTTESIRNDYFSQSGLHYLICGPTGTGKSLAMGKYSKLQITCSGQTTAIIMQRLIETKINKRRRKGYYASDEGHITIFIDDLNMPQREPQGAQPAIEILRQWMDQGGWYDLETKEFKFMCDITFTTAMQPPSGGRNSVTMRYLRYFNLLYVGGFDNDSITNMLNVFVDWVFLKINIGLELVNVKSVLVKNTINLFQQIQLNLLPTPTKSHYVYNIRDIFKIFEGISKTQSISSQYQFLKLWTHECLRIFSDRLVDQYDQKIFEQIITNVVSNNGYTIEKLKTLVYAQFLSGTYAEVVSIQVLKDHLQQLLDEHNQLHSQSRLSLILFNMAIFHITRITRILSSTYGHALLIGMGGSGRSSLSKLANYIVFNEIVKIIDQRQWDDQLLTIIKDVGLEEHHATIIFRDSQFQEESMLEDVCNLMSHGEVPHLFTPEDRLKIQEEMSFKEFVQVCKLNIHVILCMQPVGSQFRKRLRTFPTLINYSTIDWFMSWPDEALESTATQFLPSNLVKMAVEVHHKIQEIQQLYFQELRRSFYVTPTLYLQMLSLFKKLHAQKTDLARISIDRFETGIEKIVKTEQDVDKIRNILFQLQPKLEKATLDNLKLLNHIKKKQQEADQTRQQCEKEEQECSIQREEANQLRDLCQTQLNNVLPLLSQATESLDKISKDDMVFLKSFQKPPESAAIVMEGLCYAFQEDEKIQTKNKEQPTTQDFWDYAKKFLLNERLIKRIKKMKIDQIRAIDKSKITKLELFIQNPLFEKEKVFNASSAAGNLAQWIRAVLATYQAVEIIQPKKAQLAQAEINLKEAEEQVRIKRLALEESLSVLNKLSVEYEKVKIEKEEIEAKVQQIQAQLHRAEKLTSGLGEEKQRWKKKAQIFKSEQHNIEGDCILSSAIISYLGIFPIQYRDSCIQFWKMRLKNHQVSYSDDYSIQKHLCDPITINRWIQQKLPNDQFSIDNAIILKQSTRWPLMIDPQIQANEWIKNMEEIKSLLILDATQKSQQVQLKLEHAIQIGYAVLLENLGDSIDPLYEPILQQKIIKKQHKSMIKFGDRLIDYAHDFKFYMTTKLSNPHYQPQICVLVTMLNFQVTQEGLMDQMLNIVVKIDEPAKEEQRIKNIQQFFLNKNKQLNTEDLILQLLSESAGDLLENEDLITTLQKSKEEGLEIEERLKKLVHDNQTFNQIREYYFQVANTVANLYFLVNDMSMAEPTYLWSLEFYIHLYQKAIKEAAYGKKKRIENIINKFTYLLYITINRSLLEKDKLIFRFLLCLKVMNIPTLQIRACVMGPTITETNIPIPEGYTWITQKMWLGLIDISLKIPDVFGWIIQDFISNKQFWDNFYNSPQSYKIEVKNLSQFHINLIVKIIKPEQFILATNEMIRISLGKQFLENIPSTFEAFYQESNSATPLLCLVTRGADPRQNIMNLAQKFNYKFTYVSLGQGQVQLALNMIHKAIQDGGWVLLQNCHVANSFMPELEHLYQTLPKLDVHKEFRLWLTSLPTNLLPYNVVLKALKMTYELPRGLKNNLLRTFYQQDPIQFESCKKLNEWKNIFYSLSLFHAILLERRKFGALGWNISYNFSSHDLEISNEQLKYFLENHSEIQWDAIHYLIAETNYGGRVTDPQDRKLLNVILQDFLTPKVLQEGYHFCDNYIVPHPSSLKSYIDFIHQFPLNDPPQLFGLHKNAEIYTAILETKNLSQTVLQLLPRSLGSSILNPDRVVRQKVDEILEQLPKLFDIVEVEQQYPLLSKNSLNTVLQQELVRYNKLIDIMNSTLHVLQKALNGYIPLSDESMEIYNKIFDNQVPIEWAKHSYPSLKELGAWIIDLTQRLKFFTKWVIEGEPIIFWLGGFFFQQSFMTGILQNYARKQKISFDNFTFEYKFYQDEPLEKIDEGCFIHGIYIDGAQFDFKTHSLEEPEPYVLYYQAPYILFMPTTVRKEYQYYSCPLYNTAQRQGALSTTGYSINFIRNVRIPSRQSAEHWIKRGVAMVLQLD